MFVSSFSIKDGAVLNSGKTETGDEAFFLCRKPFELTQGSGLPCRIVYSLMQAEALSRWYWKG